MSSKRRPSSPAGRDGPKVCNPLDTFK